MPINKYEVPNGQNFFINYLITKLNIVLHKIRYQEYWNMILAS